jgi:hypothetical protein
MDSAEPCAFDSESSAPSSEEGKDNISLQTECREVPHKSFPNAHV